MNWLVLALLGALVYTIVNFVDKAILVHAVRNARAIPVFLAIVHLIMGTILWLIADHPVFPSGATVRLLLSGALVICGTFLLFQAYTREETSKVVVWAQMLPVVALILSVLVLNETLTTQQLFGFGLVLIASIGLSLDPSSNVLRPSTALWFILGAVIVWASSDVLLKWTLNQYPQLVAQTETGLDVRAFLAIIAYQSWGFAIGGAILTMLIAPIRHAFFNTLVSTPKRGFVFLFLNETLFILRQYLKGMALALGSVAIVTVLDGTRAFVGIILGWLLTRLFPRTYQENITARALLFKAVFALLLFVGLLVTFLVQN